jgi:hypothetical protein
VAFGNNDDDGEEVIILIWRGCVKVFNDVEELFMSIEGSVWRALILFLDDSEVGRRWVSHAPRASPVFSQAWEKISRSSLGTLDSIHEPLPGMGMERGKWSERREEREVEGQSAGAVGLL